MLENIGNLLFSHRNKVSLYQFFFLFKRKELILFFCKRLNTVTLKQSFTVKQELPWPCASQPAKVHCCREPSNSKMWMLCTHLQTGSKEDLQQQSAQFQGGHKRSVTPTEHLMNVKYVLTFCPWFMVLNNSQKMFLYNILMWQWPLTLLI